MIFTWLWQFRNVFLFIFVISMAFFGGVRYENYKNDSRVLVAVQKERERAYKEQLQLNEKSKLLEQKLEENIIKNRKLNKELEAAIEHPDFDCVVPASGVQFINRAIKAKSNTK